MLCKTEKSSIKEQPMKAPAFWYQHKLPFYGHLLRPLSWLLYFVGRIRFYRKPAYTGRTPVICVGNATIGGNGKTPTCIYLAKLCQHLGYRPLFLSRGYGGRLTEPTLVNDTHSWQDTGDEVQLLKNYAPVIIARNRVAGANYAESLGYDVIIMDDGLQNHPCFSAHNPSRLPLLIVDKQRLWGNGYLIPAGPLREPCETALEKAKAVIAIGTGEIKSDILSKAQKPLLSAVKDPVVQGQDLQGQRVILFAGLGHNQQFFDMVRQQQAVIVESYDFPDHHVYTDVLLKRLVKQAMAENALLVTTEKDMIRIPAAYYPYIHPFMIRLVFSKEDEMLLEQQVADFLSHNKQG
jgi:tetraacyldisaccharide 4'-kinase